MQGVEKLDAAFTESFNKQDAAGIAREFTKDGILLSQTPQGAVHSGTQAITQRYDALFKLGASHLDVTRSQLTSLDSDAAIALGEYHVTGQGQNGPIKADGDWSATYVRDAGLRGVSRINYAGPTGGVLTKGEQRPRNFLSLTKLPL
jgi:ketosteroid isomerase-like protein